MRRRFGSTVHLHLARVGACGSLATSLGACTLPNELGGTQSDASRWFDVDLPDASIPDAFILTQLAYDGTTTVNASATCPTADATLSPVVGTASDASVSTFDAADAADADAAPLDAPLDAVVNIAPANACGTPPGPGDLVFDEVMIATEVGSDDRGQWVEVRSTRACSLDLIGLHASAPHGESFRTMDVATDLWLPPEGFFVVADTANPTENNSLPGLVLAWAGSPADALHKTSDTITLSLGTLGVTIDSLSYPDKKRILGVSMSFPSKCAPALRANFSTWQPSMSSWTAGLFGTPNAANADVTCSAPAIPTCTPARRQPR